MNKRLAKGTDGTRSQTLIDQGNRILMQRNKSRIEIAAEHMNAHGLENSMMRAPDTNLATPTIASLTSARQNAMLPNDLGHLEDRRD